jgi:hypothetical protein
MSELTQRQSGQLDFERESRVKTSFYFEEADSSFRRVDLKSGERESINWKEKTLPFHRITPVSATQCVLTGGLNPDGSPSRAVLLLDFSSSRIRQLPDMQCGRYAHGHCVFNG